MKLNYYTSKNLELEEVTIAEYMKNIFNLVVVPKNCFINEFFYMLKFYKVDAILNFVMNVIPHNDVYISILEDHMPFRKLTIEQKCWYDRDEFYTIEGFKYNIFTSQDEYYENEVIKEAGKKFESSKMNKDTFNLIVGGFINTCPNLAFSSVNSAINKNTTLMLTISARYFEENEIVVKKHNYAFLLNENKNAVIKNVEDENASKIYDWKSFIEFYKNVFIQNV